MQMPNLKNNEFQMISDILLELYSMNDLKEIEHHFLMNVRALIPYNQSNFRAVSPDSGEVLKDGTVFIDTDAAMIPVFFHNIEPEKNYLKNLFNYRESIVYNETDLLDEDVRKNTEFYRDYLLPQKIPYSCGIILIEEEKLIGVISIFRSREWGDFTEKELFILNIFKNHLTKIIMRCLQRQKQTIVFEDSNLTPREREIAEMIFSDVPNFNIAQMLYISANTLKKHSSNIYRKLGVSSRNQLRQMLSEIGDMGEES